MDRKEIIRKVLEKTELFNHDWKTYSIEVDQIIYYDICPETEIRILDVGCLDDIRCDYAFNFEHFVRTPKFAKAFWGEKETITMQEVNDYTYEQPIWEYHLQQMVLEEDPIQYLEKFING